MIKINKGIEPVELTKYKQQPNASYRDMHGAPSGKSNSDGTPIDVYTIVLNRLIQEQGCICAYCMCRIPEKGKKATIEHIDPQSATSEEKALVKKEQIKNLKKQIMNYIILDGNLNFYQD